MDAWMREAEVAMTSLEDIETRTRTTKNVNVGDWGNRKLLELWVKLDQLEALLLNPPPVPVLTEEAVVSRWDLLLDIRNRTRAVAAILFALSSSKRSDCSDTGDDTEAVKSDGHHHVGREGTISSIKDDPELMMPLISDDATESPLKKRRLLLHAVMTCLSKSCWPFCAVLGGFAILSTLFILSAVLCFLTPGDPYMPLPSEEIIRRVSKQEGPGNNPFRPDQKTPIKNFFLAGSCTKQDYIDSMEGEELVALQKVTAAALESENTLELSLL